MEIIAIYTEKNSDSNYDQLIPLCKYLYSELDSFSFAYDFVVPIGNASQTGSYIDAKQATQILDEYYIFSKEHSLVSKKTFNLKPSHYNIYENMKAQTPLKTSYNYPMISGCHIGWTSICILHNGDVLPCRRLPVVLGNLKHDSFEDIFLGSELLRKFRRFFTYQEKCGTCEYGIACRGCPAISYARTDDCFSSFELCTHSSLTEYKPDIQIPEIDCSNEEEMEYFKSSMKSFVALNHYKIFSLFPEIANQAKKIISTTKSQGSYIQTTDEFNKLTFDEAYCLGNLFAARR